MPRTAGSGERGPLSATGSALGSRASPVPLGLEASFQLQRPPHPSGRATAFTSQLATVARLVPQRGSLHRRLSQEMTA